MGSQVDIAETRNRSERVNTTAHVPGTHSKEAKWRKSWCGEEGGREYIYAQVMLVEIFECLYTCGEFDGSSSHIVL